MTTLLPPGTRFTANVRIYGPDTAEVAAVATPTPGLAVWQWPTRPMPLGVSNAAVWTVGHLRTGLTVGYFTKDPEHAMAFATALGDVCDWTASYDELRGDLGVEGGRKWTQARDLADQMGMSIHHGSAPSDAPDVNPV